MKKIFNSFLALSVTLTPLASIVISYPSKAQVQNDLEVTRLNQLIDRAIAQTQQGQPRSAIATLQKTIELARKLKNTPVEAYALLGVGQNYSTLGEPQSALNIARQFPEIAKLFETKPANIEALRANIAPGTVIIQPVLLTEVGGVPNTMALFVLSIDKLSVIKQKLDPELFDTLVTQYRTQLTTASSRQYQATSRKLYNSTKYCCYSTWKQSCNWQTSYFTRF